MASQADLIKPILIHTNVPAPPRNSPVKYEGDDLVTPETPLIELQACSEFIEYASAVNYFSSTSRLKAVQGFRGEPIIFAVGEDDRLKCLIHEPGVSQGWGLHDISPSPTKIVAFDVLVTLSDDTKSGLGAGAFLTAAALAENSTTKVYVAFLPASSLKGSTVGTTDVSSSWFNIPWRELPDPNGGKYVTSLLLGTVKGRKADQSPAVIFAGTKELQLKAATYYAVDTTLNVQDPWTPFSLDADADRVLDLQPASFETEDGIYLLSEKSGRTECKIYLMESGSLSLNKTNSLSTLPGSLGRINSICSSRNPWNLNDLVFACESGISFINHRHPTNAPQVINGLPKTSYKEVVCSEKINPLNKAETCIIMFAVSEDNELYYIEGSRKWATDGTIAFKTSGLPIRQNVSRISCQFNSAINSSELIYTGTSANEIIHLLRDPVTTCWSESRLSFAAPQALRKYQAYVTTISVQRSDGGNVGENFPVKITAESTMVLINDRSYTLSTRATEVRTDAQGQITVVSTASDTLRSTSYTVEIAHNNVNHIAIIDAAQRVIQKLSELDTPDKLANAKTTTGEAVFDKNHFKGRSDELKQSAELLKELPTMISTVSGSGSTPVTTSQEISLEKGAVSPSSLGTTQTSAIMNTASTFESITGFLGDALEFIRYGIKQGFKAVFTPVLKGIKIILTIAGKIISVIVDAVGPLIHAVGSFLKDTLGIDFGKFFKMLGLTFDVEQTKENQKIIYDTLRLGLRLPGELIRSNTQNLDEFFGIIEAGLKPYLGDNTRAQNSEDPEKVLKNSPLAWLLNNPIMKILSKLNPIPIILDAFSEAWDESGLGDDIFIPNLVEFLTPLAKTLWKGFQEVIAEFIEFIKDIGSKITDTISDPSQAMQKIKEALQSAVWWLFNTLKTLVMTAWKAVGELSDGLANFLEAEWKIPFVTGMFKWYAEQDFTLMNAATFIMARLLGIILGDHNVAKCLDSEGTLDEISAVAKRSDALGAPLKAALLEKITIEPEISSRSVTRMAEEEVVQPRILSESRNVGSTAAPSLTVRNIIHQKGAHPPPSNTAPSATKKGHSMSEDAEHRIHKFHKYSKIISSFVGVFKFATICFETAHVMAGEGLGGGGGHAGAVSMTLPTVNVIGTAISFSGSVLQLCNWLAAREYSEEVKLHLDQSFGSICAGVSVSLSCNLVATGASIAAFGLAKGGKEPKGLTALSGFFLCLGTYGEVVGIHLIPAFRSDESQARTKILGFIEAIANTGGLVAIFAAHARQPKVMGVALLVDGLGTFANLLDGLAYVLES